MSVQSIVKTSMNVVVVLADYVKSLVFFPGYNLFAEVGFPNCFSLHRLFWYFWWRKAKSVLIYEFVSGFRIICIFQICVF